VNKCNHVQLPIAENLPLIFPENVGIIQVCGLRSSRRKGFFGKNERLPMYTFPLLDCLDRYYTYDLKIPNADRRGVGGMHATWFSLHGVPVANYQFFCGGDSTAHPLRCTDHQSFHNAEPRNNWARLRVDEPPEGDVGDLWPAQLLRILWVQDALRERLVVLLRELQLETKGLCLHSNELLRVSNIVFRGDQANLCGSEYQAHMGGRAADSHPRYQILLCH